MKFNDYRPEQNAGHVTMTMSKTVEEYTQSMIAQAVMATKIMVDTLSNSSRLGLKR